MREILVDSNVILDVVTEDTTWFEWSSGQLARLAEDHVLAINPIVYSEVSVGFERIEDVDSALPADFFRREALPWEAAFLAAKCFLRPGGGGGRAEALSTPRLLRGGPRGGTRMAAPHTRCAALRHV